MRKLEHLVPWMRHFLQNQLLVLRSTNSADIWSTPYVITKVMFPHNLQNNSTKHYHTWNHSQIKYTNKLTQAVTLSTCQMKHQLDATLGMLMLICYIFYRTHVPVAAVLVLNTPDDGRLCLKHVEWLSRNKTCTVLHQVGVSFDLYYDAQKHKIKTINLYSWGAHFQSQLGHMLRISHIPFTGCWAPPIRPYHSQLHPFHYLFSTQPLMQIYIVLNY